MRAFIGLVVATAAAVGALPHCDPGTHVVTDEHGRPRDYAPGQGVNCEPCGPGTYAEHVSQLKCTPCQPGRFSTVVAANKRLTCTPCPAGTYWPDERSNPKTSNLGSASLEAACTACAAGSYSDKQSARTCQLCKPGRYRATEGARHANDCVLCAGRTMALRQTPRTDPETGATRLEFVFGATFLEQTCTPRPVDCLVSPWGGWSRCTKVCGGGRQSRSRSVTQPRANGGATCPAKMDDVRDCNAEPCSGLDTRYPLYEELLDGAWWQVKFGAAGHEDFADTAPGMQAECRYQKVEGAGPWAFTANAENVVLETGGTERVLGKPVEGWCCHATSEHPHRAIGKTWCYETPQWRVGEQQVLLFGTAYKYAEETGKMCHGARCAQFKPLVVHKRRCKHVTCKVEEHRCTKYDAAHKGICGSNSTLLAEFQKQGGAAAAHPGYCPNAGWGNCKLAPGVTHTSLRVMHANDEERNGHYCASTADGTCECFCHDMYGNAANLRGASPHFGQHHTDGNAVTKENEANFGRSTCKLPAAGEGDAYDPFTSTTKLTFRGETYRPVGPCKGVGCYVLRSRRYESGCDLHSDAKGSTVSPALRSLCKTGGFHTTRSCNSVSERCSQAAFNLWMNGAERATFFRVKNNLGAKYVRSPEEGLYFYDFKGVELLHIRPDGPQFQGQNRFNFFANVPDRASYALLRGGGASDDGDDYSGIDVSFFTC